MLTTIFERRGTCIGLAYPNSFLERGHDLRLVALAQSPLTTTPLSQRLAAVAADADAAAVGGVVCADRGWAGRSAGR